MDEFLNYCYQLSFRLNQMKKEFDNSVIDTILEKTQKDIVKHISKRQKFLKKTKGQLKMFDEGAVKQNQ